MTSLTKKRKIEIINKATKIDVDFLDDIIGEYLSYAPKLMMEKLSRMLRDSEELNRLYYEAKKILKDQDFKEADGNDN